MCSESLQAHPQMTLSTDASNPASLQVALTVPLAMALCRGLGANIAEARQARGRPAHATRAGAFSGGRDSGATSSKGIVRRFFSVAVALVREDPQAGAGC